MHISLVLYAEHEFNASTFTSRVIAGTGVSALGCTLPEKEGHTVSGARDIADKLLAVA